MISTQELWKKILAEIQTEISSANFLTLFKVTSLLSYEDGVATIAAPSAMIIDLLNKRFYEVIKKTVDKHVGGQTKLIFVPRAVATSSADPGPLFSFSEKSKPSVGHLPRVRAEYTF